MRNATPRSPVTHHASRTTRLLAALKHAFALAPADDVLSAEDLTLIQKVADAVVRRRMSAPAVLFLESIKPLNYVASQVATFFQPFLTTCFNRADCERVSRLLERREAIELLIAAIERRFAANGARDQTTDAEKGTRNTQHATRLALHVSRAPSSEGGHA
jgi:hypothetical protein